MTRSAPFAHAEILQEIVQPLLIWYHAQARSLPWRENPSPYRVWLSEIMLQQTRVAAVLPYFDRFLNTLPDVRTLANCDEEVLMKLWQGLGYYNRARNLQKAARIVMSEYSGVIPSSFEELLALPGIGRYTAAAISSIAYGGDHPAVDGNVLRVISRLILFPEDILKDASKRAVEEALHEVYPPKQGGELNQALMELGAMVCLPNGEPHCSKCPLQRLCLACEENCIAEYPRKKKQKPRRIEKMTILHLEADGNIAIRKRPKNGLLAGLWELPHLPGHQPLDEVRSWCHAQGYSLLSGEPLPPARHIFSHVEWDMLGWHLQVAPACVRETGADDAEPSHNTAKLQWQSPEAITASYSIPAAFRHYLYP